MKEPTSDTEGRYGDGAARTKVCSPRPKTIFYHVCSNRIELLFHNGEHKVALVRSAIKQVAKRQKGDYSNVREDHLDKRWEAATGEVVDEVIFLSRHTAASNRPALTIHPIGILLYDLSVNQELEDEVPPAGGKPGWAAPPNARMGPWLRLLKGIAESHNLTPEFEVTLEATHHGPITDSPTMFVEIGSTEEYWKRQDAAQAIALVRMKHRLVWKGLGLDGGIPVGDWRRNNGKKKILLGVGGGHYVPRHMDIVL
ncbi:hypothetical protein L1987_80242 [Smallanthus sonchifolius]|uniref:Uncharacterized protein n=1 Tax=Smallanthus sonchifolius TaxID=185202 RepID=A0ACB8YMC1_9ASTR|nr:hypothetical protein L1987_80242 [Smallanthus sonchifolius]